MKYPAGQTMEFRAPAKFKPGQGWNAETSFLVTLPMEMTREEALRYANEYYRRLKEAGK